MFCTIDAREKARGTGRLAGAAALALAALAAFAPAALAQQQDNIVKQGAKLLGFATDEPPPVDFVEKSRPDHDLDYIPVFQAPPEPERKALQDDELKAMRSDLDALQKRHDALRGASAPAGKTAAQPAAKKAKAAAADAQK